MINRGVANAMFSNFDDRRDDNRLCTKLFLNKPLELNSQVFLKETAVEDMFPFHIADRIDYGLTSVFGKTIRFVNMCDALKRNLRLAYKFVRSFLNCDDE